MSYVINDDYHGIWLIVCILLWKVIFYLKKGLSVWNLSHLLLFFQVDDEAMDLNKELMSKLLELDDVDDVYTDQK